MSNGKGQQVMEYNWVPLEFQSSDRKDALQTAQKRCQLKIQSFCKCYLQYTCRLRRRLYHEWNTLFSCNFDMGISYTPIFLSECIMFKITDSRFQFKLFQRESSWKKIKTNIFRKSFKTLEIKIPTILWSRDIMITSQKKSSFVPYLHFAWNCSCFTTQTAGNYFVIAHCL